jgi:hypothetical protein
LYGGQMSARLEAASGVPARKRSLVGPAWFALVVLGCSPRHNAPARQPETSHAPVSEPRPTAPVRALVFTTELSQAEWEHPKTRFDPDLARTLDPDALRALWQKLEDAGGSFRGVESVSPPAAVGELRQVIVSVTFQRIRKELRIAFDRSDRVVGVLYAPVAADLEAKTRRLITAAARADFDSACTDFGEVLRDALPPSKLQTIWHSLEQQFGNWQAIESVSLVPIAGSWADTAITRFERGSVPLRVVYDDRNLVVGLWLAPEPNAIR